MEITKISKRCYLCQQYKEPTEFYKHPLGKFGVGASCKECSIKESRRRRLENPHKSVEYSVAYRERHLEKFRDYQNKYYRNRRHLYTECLKEKEFRNRHRRREWAKGSGFSRTQWIELCLQFGNRCVCCGDEKRLTCDHIIPLSRGGTNAIENIQPLCQSCNSRKGVTAIDYRYRWLYLWGTHEPNKS